MWLAAVVLIAKLAAGMAKVAAAAPWHCAQLLVCDGAFAWMAVMEGIVAKFEVVWHAGHPAAAEVGIWLAGLDGSVKSLKLPWQSEQSPPMGCKESTTTKVSLLAFGRIWNPLKGAVLVMGYCPMLIQALPASWHELQLPVTPA
jgi:hypothetical protein